MGIEELDPERTAELVREDIERGLQFAFRSIQPPRIVDAFGPVDRNAVQWEWSCQHVGVWQGLKPWGKELTIRGCTVVELVRDEKDPVRYRRYVDWSEVMVALGMAATYRPVITAEDVERQI